MEIASYEVLACSPKLAEPDDGLRGEASSSKLDFIVHTIATTCGRRASMFGFAGASAEGSAQIAVAIAPLLKGRNVHDREALWHDFRKRDRMWGHFPIYIWGPIDTCLWLLAAEAAELPLYRYIGSVRDSVPVYASSMFLKDSDAYVAEALATRAAGFAAYKLHPPGISIHEDLDIHSAVRHAVGDKFTLMSDPVAFMSLPEALRYGRGLERLGYHWFEEPLADENFSALQELSRQLDIPVVGAETIAKHPYSVADMVSRRIVDVVRADVSWSGGVTAVLKTAHLAESFAMNCEIHTSIFHPLELVNLHLCGAVSNCTFLEVLAPMSKFAFGLKQPLPIEQGIATLPDSPGLGCGLDWDFIDNSTAEKFA